MEPSGQEAGRGTAAQGMGEIAAEGAQCREEL